MNHAAWATTRLESESMATESKTEKNYPMVHFFFQMYSPDPEALRHRIEVLGNGVLVPQDAFSASASQNNSKESTTLPASFIQSSHKPSANRPLPSQASHARQAHPLVQPPGDSHLGKHRLPAAASSLLSMPRPLAAMRLNNGLTFNAVASEPRSDAIVRFDKRVSSCCYQQL